ncbi:MAG TPA: hypothetical protein VGE98_02130, partial [Thermoanaerobaculia bacterium]
MRGSAPVAAGTLEPGTLPPFLTIERTLRLGLDWQVATRVVRATPPGVPVVAEVPLLPGESVTSAGIRVAQGKALVNLGPQATEAAWTSTLAQAPRLVLRAPRELLWSEVWRLDDSPIWPVEWSGIP